MKNKKPIPKTLIIDRSQWLKGETAQKSRLLRSSDRKMCCLGFLTLACGAKESQIESKHCPENLPNINWPKGILNLSGNANTALKDTWKTLQLMSINDMKICENHEEQLKKIFNDDFKIKLKFVNKIK